MILLGAGGRVVASISMSMKALGSSLMRPERIFVRTVGEDSGGVVLVRGRPSKDVRPSMRSGGVAGELVDYKRVVKVRIVSRVVVKSKVCFDFGRGVVVWFRG